MENHIRELRRLGKLPAKKASVNSGPESEQAAYWRGEATALRREVETLKGERTAVDILVAEVKSLAPKAYSPPRFTVKMVKRSAGTPQSALLMLSDTHIGQFIEPDQTLGLGNYNFQIFANRLKRLENSVFSIIQDHTTTAVPEIVVAMIGDMMHGNLSHAVEAGQVNTLFTQFYSAGHAIAQFLRNISTLAPVRIETAVGNHTRWGTQKKMPTDNRYSNLDQFLYAYLAALLRDNPRISFNLTRQPFALFDVQGFRFYAGHGDHLKGGDRILGVPNHAIGRNLSNTSQLFGAAGIPFPNYFLFGHFHRPITLPTASGEVIINGGFPGLDGFGLTQAFNASPPSQKFFLVHPKFGRSACYDLKLETKDEATATPAYELPSQFLCK